MLSSEISDLEQFIDSYVGPDPLKASSSGERTQSYDSNPGSYNFMNSAFEDNVPRSQPDNGAEFWGQKPSGKEWGSSVRAQPNTQPGGWHEHRPNVQNREMQWQQQMHEMSQQQQQQQQHQQQQHFQQQQHHFQQQQHFQQQPSHYQQPPQQHYQPQPQLPQHYQQIQHHQMRPEYEHPQPPFQPHPRHEFHPPLEQYPSPIHRHAAPHLPDQMQNWGGEGSNFGAASESRDPNQIQTIVSNLIRQNNMQQPPQNLPPWVDTTQPPPLLQDQQHPGRDLQGKEPILHSMTFQRQSSSSDVFSSDEKFQSNVGPNTSNWGSFNDMERNLMQNSVQTQQQGGNWDKFNPRDLEFSSAATSSNQTKVPSHASQRQFESNPDSQRPPIEQAMKQQTHSKPQTSPAEKKYQNSRLRSSTSSDDNNIDRNSSRNNSFRSNRTALLPTPEAKSDRQSHSNSSVSHSQGSGDWGRQSSRHSSSDFYEHDEKWNRNEASNKNKVQRRKSAADEDTNWRKRDPDAGEKPREKRKGRQEEAGRKSGSDWKNSHRENENRPKDKRSSPNEKEINNNRPKRKDDLVITTNTENQQRRVTNLGKSKVQSWIADEMAYNSAGKEISKLHITDPADLTKFIESTQAFATTESKMREVAEILCNKALKNRKFSRNAAILCDRMSLMMVHGTKFRSVVLNVMQGHYKNRDQLFNATFRGDKRWFGFITFLVEIFLNVRTAQGERLTVLIEPVFNSLFQVLRSAKVEKDQVECFGQLFMVAGPPLETEKSSKMSDLMAEIRDRCVVSKTAAIRKVLLACVEYYSTKWKKIETK